MSAVRMCDRCGTIFAEGAEGSTTGTATRTNRDDYGRMQNITVAMDQCPDCSGGKSIRPRVAIAATGKE